MQPGAEYAHIRAAVFTASPQRSYWKRLWPMTPAIAAPEWMPIWHWRWGNHISESSVFTMSITCTIENESAAIASARSFRPSISVRSGRPAATM